DRRGTRTTQPRPSGRRALSPMGRAPRPTPPQPCSHTTAGNGPAPSGRTIRTLIGEAGPSGEEGARTVSPAAHPATRRAKTKQARPRIVGYRLPRMTTKPAVSLVAVAGGRQAEPGLAPTRERGGFQGHLC